MSTINSGDERSNEDDDDLDHWFPDYTEDTDFYQTHTAVDPNVVGSGEQSVGCTVASSRTDTDVGHDYKISDKLKVTYGYKVRSNAAQTIDKFGWERKN